MQLSNMPTNSRYDFSVKWFLMLPSYVGVMGLIMRVSTSYEGI